MRKGATKAASLSVAYGQAASQASNIAISASRASRIACAMARSSGSVPYWSSTSSHVDRPPDDEGSS